jgi:hypothetical protein
MLEMSLKCSLNLSVRSAFKRLVIEPDPKILNRLSDAAIVFLICGLSSGNSNAKYYRF